MRKNYALVTLNFFSNEPIRVEAYPTEKAAEDKMILNFKSVFKKMFDDAGEDLDKLEDLISQSENSKEPVLDEKNFFLGGRDLESQAMLKKGFARIVTPEEESPIWQIQEIALPAFSERAKELIVSLFEELAVRTEKEYLDEIVRGLMTEEEAEKLNLKEYYPKEEEEL